MTSIWPGCVMSSAGSNVNEMPNGSVREVHSSHDFARPISSAACSVVRPNGSHPCPDVSARRNDSAVRPPNQIGTRSCTAWGSMMKSSKA